MLAFSIWAAVTGQERFFSSRQSAMFVVLTVLHALHVLGGLVRLIQVRVAAAKAEYSSGHHEPLVNAGLYWHFLDVVWVLMLVAILSVALLASPGWGCETGPGHPWVSSVNRAGRQGAGTVTPRGGE